MPLHVASAIFLRIGKGGGFGTQLLRQAKRTQYRAALVLGQRVQLRRAYNRGLLCSKLADRPKAAAALQTASAAVLASMTAVCVFRQSSAVLQVAMGLMLGGALANLVERWARGAVTDYVYLPRAVIPFFRRIIWNVADLSVFAGCLMAIGVLACEAV